MLVHPVKTQDLNIKENLAQLRRIFAAFSWRDIQVSNTIFYWMQVHDISIEQFRGFVVVSGIIDQLNSAGYFNTRPNIEEAKRVRALECAVEDPRLRSYVRSLRLKYTAFSERGRRS